MLLLPRGTRDATRRLRRFEARWAWRGARRPPSQTPLEFALELESRALAPRDDPSRFVREYYRARYGSPEISRPASGIRLKT
jgi:hypothetical protein